MKKLIAYSFAALGVFYIIIQLPANIRWLFS
jgi:hypothetical protein